MPISQLLLDKIGQYESEGHDADSIVSGLSESQNFPDIAAKVKDYQSKGYTSEDILSGLKSSPVESQPSLIQKGLQAGKEALGSAGEFIGKSVIEPGMEAIGLKEYADVPAAFVRGATAGWVEPKTEAPTEPEGIGHTIAKEAAYLGGMAVPTKYIGMGLRGLGLLPKGAGIVSRAIGGAETLGGYGAISAPEEGRTKTERIMDDVIMGAVFGAGGGVVEKIASKVSPAVAGLLEKRAIGLKAGKNITPEIAETLKLTPAEEAAAKMLPYITSASLGAGAGAAEPAEDMGERLRHIITGAGAFTASHGISDIAGNGVGLMRGRVPVEPQPQPEARTETGIERAPIVFEPEKAVKKPTVEPERVAEQVPVSQERVAEQVAGKPTKETEQVLSEAEKTVATKESGEAENPQEAISDEVELPESPKQGSKEPLKGKVYRVAPAEIPMDEVQDHWVTTSIEDAQKMKDQMEASGNHFEVTLKDGSKVMAGKAYTIYEIDAGKVNEAGGESKGKSPYKTGADWVKTETELKPDAIVGEVKAGKAPAPEAEKAEEQPAEAPDVSAREKVTNVLKSYETHPNRTIAMAEHLGVSPEEFETMRKNIIDKGAPGTDKERELVRLIASGEYRNVGAEVKTEREAKGTEVQEPIATELKPIATELQPKEKEVPKIDISKMPYVERGAKVKGTDKYILKIMNPEGKEIGRTIGDSSPQGHAEALQGFLPKQEEKPAFDTAVLEHMKSRIEMGEAGGVTGAEAGFRGRFASTYPEWFKNKGFTKDRALTAINKAMKGHPLTDKQQELIETLYEGAKEEHAKASKIYKEMDAERSDIINEKKDGIELDPSKLKEGDAVIINGEKFTHKGFDKDGNIIIADSQDYRLDIGDKLMVDKVEKGAAQVIPDKNVAWEDFLASEEAQKIRDKYKSPAMQLGKITERFHEIQGKEEPILKPEELMEVEKLRKTARFEAGKKLTKDQRAEVLKKTGDSYRDLNAPKEGFDLRTEEPKEPKRKPIQKDMFGAAGATLEGPLPSKELGETPLEKAAKEAEGRKIEEEEKKRQGGLSLSEGKKEGEPVNLSSEQINRLLVDALRISAPGSEAELKKRIEIDPDTLKDAVGKWSEGDISQPFVIKGAHRTVSIGGDRMASIMEFSLSHMDETTPHHEAFHSVQELLLNDKERTILDNKFPTKEGISSSERQAEAFAQWVANKKKLLPLSVKEIFGKIKGFFESIRNALHGLGFQNVEDIFGKAWRGEYRQRAITETSRREMGLSAAMRKSVLFEGQPMFQTRKPSEEEMKRLNVRYEGMQEIGEGAPIPLYTDLETGSSFYLPEGRLVEEGAQEVRGRYGEMSLQISPEEDRILRHVSYGEKDTRTFGEKIKNWSSTAYTNFIDKFHPIRRMEKEIAGKAELKAIESPYKRMRLLAGSMVGKASSALEYKTIDFKTYGFNGEGLSTILKPVIESGELRNFTAYLTAKRAIEKSEQGIETGIDISDAQAVVNQSEAKYGAKAQQLYDYNDRILQYYRDSGMISDDAYNAMKNRNMFYVPFYRVVNKLSGMGKGSEAWQAIKKMKGAETDIIDPIESIVKNTYLLTSMAEKNDAMRTFVNFADGTGVIRKARPDVHMHVVSMKEMLKNENLKDFLDELDSEGPELVSEQIMDEVANIFRPNMMKDPNTIVVFEDGKPQYYTIADESVARAIKGIDRETMPLLVQVLSKPASWLRAGATLSPEFMMRNPVRDWFSAMAYSKYGFNPVKFFSGLKSSAVKDETFWKWMVGGGSQSSFVSLDRQNLSKTSVELMRRAYLKGQIKNKEYREALGTIPKNPVEMLRILSELGEEGTRLAEFKAGIGKEGETKEGLLESAFQSREVTLDFGRIGAKMKAVNMLISFFNANVQGMDKMIRNLNFRENPRLAMKTAMKAVMTMTIPSMLLAWATKDDKDIDEIPRWQRDIFWIVPVGEGKDKTFYRIPKPFELGTVFATIPERLMEYIKTHDTKSFDKIGDTIMNGAMPNMVPTFATPFMEAWANKSTFTGRPIVPRGKEELLPQYQYTHYTTDTAKRIAGLLGKIPWVGDTKVASPAQLENTLRGWTGNLGVLALKTADKALEGAGVKPKEVKPIEGLADIPGIRGFIARYPSGGAESIQRFYDNYERVSGVKATYRGLLREGKAGEAKELLRSYGDGIPNLNTFHTVLGRLNKIRDIIYSNPSISAEEKRRLLDEIYYKMISISRMGNDVVGKRINNQ